MEIADYATYDDAIVMFDVMGFGKPFDEIPILLQPGVLSIAWGTSIRQLAAGLGIEIDDITESYEREPAPEAFDTTTGHVPKGSIAAMRFEIRGMVKEQPTIVIEHVTRLREDLRPDWPQPAQPGGSYRVEITTVLRGGHLPDQPQRRPQPRRDRGRRGDRECHPRGDSGARHQNNTRLAPDYWKWSLCGLTATDRPVRWNSHWNRF